MKCQEACLSVDTQQCTSCKGWCCRYHFPSDWCGTSRHVKFTPSAQNPFSTSLDQRRDAGGRHVVDGSMVDFVDKTHGAMIVYFDPAAHAMLIQLWKRNPDGSESGGLPGDTSYVRQQTIDGRTSHSVLYRLVPPGTYVVYVGGYHRKREVEVMAGELVEVSFCGEQVPKPRKKRRWPW